MASISEEERRFRKYTIDHLALERLTVPELIELVKEKCQKEGRAQRIGKTAAKKDLIDFLLPPMAFPKEIMSFMTKAPVDEGAIDPRAPRALKDQDFFHPNGKQLTNEQLKALCLERNLPVSGKKEVLKERLRTYNPALYRPKVPKRIDVFSVRPPGNCLLAKLWDLLEEGIEDLKKDGFSVGASELLMLRPHVLQHLDNSYNYHVKKHSHYDQFVLFYCNGICHWQGQHALCRNCYQEGFIADGNAIHILETILSCSAKWISEETQGLWQE
jgi:SAP domain